MNFLNKKNSGIDWIGQIPNHWEIKRIKDVSIVSTGQTPPREQTECFSNEKDNNYLWIKPENLNSFEEISETTEYITNYGLKFIKIYNKESLILSGIGAGLGNIGISKYNFTTNQQNHILSKHKNYKYLFYFMFAAKEHVKSLSVGNILSILNATKLKNSFVLNPTSKEQQAIVSYLDTETSKIDHKISILEKKYEKLEEYKQSVIFETVTKGLDANIVMKDSGIDWIGEIPEHWGIKRVKDVSKIKKGKAVETFLDKTEDMLPSIDTNFLRGKDNIVFSKNGTKILPNKVLILWDGANAGELFFNKNTGYLGSTFGVFNTDFNNKFFFYYLKGIEQHSRNNLTGMGIPHVDGNVLKQTISLVPPKNEQNNIVAYLDIETSKIDKKKEIIKKQIELLKEYKQSIIYEAVTGKTEIGELYA